MSSIPDNSIQKHSDAMMDFSHARNHPDFKQLVLLYESFIEGEEYLLKTPEGAIVKRSLDQGFLIYAPLLLAFDAPLSSIRNLIASDFSVSCLKAGKGTFETTGLSLNFANDKLTVLTCPTKYLPSESPQNLIQCFHRSGKTYVNPFFTFLSNNVKTI